MAMEFVGLLGILSPNPLDNATNVKIIRSPLLLIHGEKDDLIPSDHSKELYRLSNSQIKQLQLCESACHNRWNYEHHVKNPVQQFLAKALTKERPERETKLLPEIIFHKPTTKKLKQNAKSNGKSNTPSSIPNQNIEKKNNINETNNTNNTHNSLIYNEDEHNLENVKYIIDIEKS